MSFVVLHLVFLTTIATRVKRHKKLIYKQTSLVDAYGFPLKFKGTAMFFHHICNTLSLGLFAWKPVPKRKVAKREKAILEQQHDAIIFTKGEEIGEFNGDKYDEVNFCIQLVKNEIGSI